MARMKMDGRAGFVFSLRMKQVSFSFRCVKIMLYMGPQRSNAARVRKLSRFNGGKLRGNSKHLFKTSKDKAIPGKRRFKR